MTSINAPARSVLSLNVASLLVLVGFTTFAIATPQTVSDEACPKYAVDIAAFATCEGDRVVKPTGPLPIAPRVLVDDEGNPLPSSAEAIPQDPLSRTHHAHYLTAREADQAKNWLGGSVLFIDVRDHVSAMAGGRPQHADYHMPVMRRTDDDKLQIAYGFVGTVKRTLMARGLDFDAPIFAICGNGRQSAKAAELLAQAGVPHVFVVRGGIQGELSTEENSVGRLAGLLDVKLR